MAKKPNEAIQQEKLFSYALNVTTNYYRLAASKLINEKFPNSLTPEQLGILLLLSKSEGLYQMQIAQILSKDRPNMTRMLNILEEKGYVERKKDGANKRILRIFITKDGLKMVEKMLPYRQYLNEIALKDISEKEMDILYETLSKIRNNLIEKFEIQI